MTLPFENDTSKVVKDLAKADLKTHNPFDCNCYCFGYMPNGNYFFHFSE